MGINVVFVCLGNICRSPMADAVFTEMVRKAGLADQISVDSCGTGGWHVGESPHAGTQKILREKGIPYEGTARQLSERDLAEADYLIAMDESNLKGIHRKGKTHAKTALLLDFAHNFDEREVPDPYYTDNFEYVYQLVEDGARGLLAHIREEHGL